MLSFSDVFLVLDYFLHFMPHLYPIIAPFPFKSIKIICRTLSLSLKQDNMIFSIKGVAVQQLNFIKSARISIPVIYILLPYFIKMTEHRGILFSTLTIVLVCIVIDLQYKPTTVLACQFLFSSSNDSITSNRSFLDRNRPLFRPPQLIVSGGSSDSTKSKSGTVHDHTSSTHESSVTHTKTSSGAETHDLSSSPAHHDSLSSPTHHDSSSSPVHHDSSGVSHPDHSSNPIHSTSRSPSPSHSPSHSPSPSHSSTHHSPRHKSG